MIAITGGAGFIGSAMVYTLNSLGITDLLIADELGDTKLCGEKWKNLVGIRFEEYFHKDDFLEKLLSEKLPPLDAVIHLGAISATTETDVERLMENNFGYTKTLALHCAPRNIRLITASSAATYGDGDFGYSDSDALTDKLRPLNPYGYSKHLFDLWALRHRLTDSLASLKFFNVFGPNEYHKGEMMSVVCKAYHQIAEHGTVNLFKSHRPDYEDGGQTRDFVYVKDCCSVMAWLLEHRDANGIFNLGTGKARSFKDLVTATFAAMEKPVRIDYIPMPDALQGKYQYYTEADMTKLRAAGYAAEFRTLEESVADYVQLHLSKPNAYLCSR